MSSSGNSTDRGKSRYLLLDRGGRTSSPDDDVTSSLRQLKQDDPKLKKVCLFTDPTVVKNKIVIRGNKVEYSPDSFEDWRDIGQGIGQNTQLKKLHVLGMREDVYPLLQENVTTIEQIDKLREMCNGGMNANSSIDELLFYRLNFNGGGFFDCMIPFFEKDCKLVNLILDQCELGPAGTRSLSSLLRKSHSIEHIYLSYNQIDDISIQELVASLNALPGLEALDLEGNHIGRNGCQALAAMIQKPKSAMKRLGLQYNDVDDKGAVILANSLKSNNKMTHLDLEIKRDFAKARETFSRILCNSASIQETYHSNHTLQFLGYYECASRASYLLVNRNKNKKFVARQKIYRNHFLDNFSMAPFAELDPDLLVHVLGFIDKASGEYLEGRNDVARHSILFHLLKNVPQALRMTSAGEVK